MTDRTDLVVILDRSGSMEARRADHEGGLRSFVRDQRALPGDVRLTFVRFDSEDSFELVYDRAPLAEVEGEKLELLPRGGTPLLDAVGQTVHHLTARIADEGRKPDLVICMVITDGQENSSRKFTLADVKKQIGEREAAGWRFLYLGANVDEFAEAHALGIAASASLGYAANKAGTDAMYANVLSNVRDARLAYSAGGDLATAMACLNFTDEQRAAARAPAAKTATDTNTGDAEGGAPCTTSSANP